MTYFWLLFISAEWSAFRYTNESVLTYGQIHIINASRLVYEQINVLDGSVVDSFDIVQEKHGQFSTSNLPPNISAEIDKERVDAGGKPGETFFNSLHQHVNVYLISATITFFIIKSLSSP